MAPRRFFQGSQKRAQLRDVSRELAPAGVDAVRQGAEPREVDLAHAPLLTVEQVAARLSIPVKAVYDLTYEHGLPVRRIGRRVRFDQAELEAWTVRDRQRQTKRVG